MGNFVRPEPSRLTISGGDYIDIKKRLNHGETEDMYARWAPFVVPGEAAQLNRREDTDREGADVPPRLVAGR
jgi:hypothetical protein